MSDPAPKRLLLIGWDAADWKVILPLVQMGLMPHTRRLLERGINGPLHSPHPLLSPLLWTSAVTGKRADQHNVLAPLELNPNLSGAQPVSRSTRKSLSIWEILDHESIPSIAINFPATHPANSTHGVVVSNHFAISDHAQALADSVSQNERPPFANVQTRDLSFRAYSRGILSQPSGPDPYDLPLARDPCTVQDDNGWTRSLNLTDVHLTSIRKELLPLRVHETEIDVASLLTFVPRAAEVDPLRDSRVRGIAQVLAHTATVHAAATWCIEHVPWQFAAVCYTGLHQLSHGFMAYHPPKLPWVSDRDFEIYCNVVTAGYQLHDLMLGRLLELAGSDATVILMSDHGFHCDHLRPGPTIATSETMTAWHRPQGIIAIGGPLQQRIGSIAGMSLFDVTPTILSMMDLPVGADMAGRSRATVVGERISWEGEAPPEPLSPRTLLEQSGSDGASPSRMELSEPEPRPPEDSAIAHLLELGYLEQPDRFAQRAAEQIEMDRTLALALVYLESGRAAAAVEVLEPLVIAQPQRRIIGITLARAYAHCRRISACRKLVEQLAAEQAQENAATHLVLGMLELEARRAELALSHLRRAEELGTALPETYILMGQCLLRLSRPEDAIRVLDRALQLDRDHIDAIEAMCAAHLLAKDAQRAVEFARRAIALRPDRARSHYLLGLAMLDLNRTQQATAAFERAVEIDRHFTLAHRKLASAYAAIEQSEKATHHEREAQASLLAERMARFRSAADRVR